MNEKLSEVQDCSVCRSHEPKYKCPKCRKPYCSVACCKQHKESCTPLETKKEDKDVTISANQKVYQYETEDTVPVEKLTQLEQSEALKDRLRNPHLRKILIELDSCEAPEKLMEKYMREPIFVEFADECLKVIEP